MSKKSKWKPRVVRPDPMYLPPVHHKETVIVSDMDGTLSLLGGRNPYDASRCDFDPPHTPVVETVKLLAKTFPLVVVSARFEKVRAQTERWLKWHDIVYRDLLMRKDGDTRNDALVKAEIFRDYLHPKYNIHAVFDDRDRVVEMWRWMGVPCFQVQFGNF